MLPRFDLIQVMSSQRRKPLRCAGLGCAGGRPWGEGCVGARLEGEGAGKDGGRG